MSDRVRRLPVGAEVQQDGSTHFRVWAPDPRHVSLELLQSQCSHDVELEARPDGYYEALVPGVGAGTRYWYRLDGERVADPASRFQPDGPFGPSQVVDPSGYAWSDAAWGGVERAAAVIYEMHVGTFTRERTWGAAAARLPQLAEVGITVVELMPVADFPGRFGWGYDGVFPYAPTRLYGTPDEFRAFVDRAHALGVAVILDVVYNHLGPEGCVFSRYSGDYFSTRYKGEWGDPLNFDGERSQPVREFFARNGAYWIEEFHLDGLRLDATQSIHDASAEHLIAEVARRARAAAGGRRVLLVAENEPQETKLVRPPAAGGYGLDALWNDDFHHSAVVALTGRGEAYYSDYRGTAQEFVSAAKHGYLFQGQRYAWQRHPRGTPTRGLPAGAFVNFLENHDQVANSLDGRRLRLRASPGRLRAATAMLLLMPGIPMLFQGQEYGATTPFQYFADLSADLAPKVQQGRGEFIAQFPSLAAPGMRQRFPVPHDPATFERSTLDWDERQSNEAVVHFHRDLLALRRAAPALSTAVEVDGAVLGTDAFVLRYFADTPADERLLVVNLGCDLISGSLAEPLVAPPGGWRWQVAWSSEDPRYGGTGAAEPVHDDGWTIAGHSAFVLEPVHGGSRADHA